MSIHIWPKLAHQICDEAFLYKFNSAGSPPWAEMLLLIAFSDA